MIFSPCRKCLLNPVCEDECGKLKDHDIQQVFIRATLFFSWWIYVAYYVARKFIT